MGVVKEYGYEYDAVPNPLLWEACEERLVTKTESGVYLLRSGRDAFKVIARENPNAVVIMPALSCDSMCVPFELYGLQIRYYRLLSTYAVDLDSVRALIRGDEAKLLFVYMDYFGNPAIDDAALQELQMRYANMIFVEDRTHTLLHKTAYSFQPDFVVASLRKWTNIPDGGLLWAKNPLHNAEFTENISFAKERLHAQEMRHTFFETGDQAIKQRYRAVFSTITDQIDNDPRPCGMSKYAFQLAQQTDWESVRNQRFRNAKTLLNELKAKPVAFIQPNAGVSDLYVALCTSRRDEIQQKLAAKGIFCTVIWPLRTEQKAACSVAKATTEGMLAVPCDQRYTEEDMYHISDEITKVLYE